MNLSISYFGERGGGVGLYIHLTLAPTAVVFVAVRARFRLSKRI